MIGATLISKVIEKEIALVRNRSDIRASETVPYEHRAYQPSNYIPLWR